MTVSYTAIFFIFHYNFLIFFFLITVFAWECNLILDTETDVILENGRQNRRDNTTVAKLVKQKRALCDCRFPGNRNVIFRELTCSTFIKANVANSWAFCEG